MKLIIWIMKLSELMNKKMLVVRKWMKMIRAAVRTPTTILTTHE